MRQRLLALTIGCAVIPLGLTGCGNAATEQETNTGKPKIGVILPDSKTSARWESADRKYLTEAFRAAKIDYDIQNAQGDKNAFQTIADQMITNGATVLMIVNLDSGTGKAVLDKAKSQGVATIDYDRLTLGGSAQYYVSFDNVKVGQLQGEGLAKCLTTTGATKPVVAELNGAPTDNNSSLFKKGYDSVLDPKYASGEYAKGPDQSVPDWDNTQAGTIFEQILTSQPKTAGVLAANDGMANAVISVLKKQKLHGKVPVTGQDATAQGLQNILAGNQCMTVYKPIKQQAQAAAQLAISLAKGEKQSLDTTVKDPQTGREVPSLLLAPQAIFKENIKDVIADSFVSRSELCSGDFAATCDEAGIE